MRKTSQLLLAIVICVLGLEITATETAAQDGPDTGFALWVRVPVNGLRQSASSITANPEFAVGYRGDSYGIGVGLGFLVARASYQNDSVTATIFQIGPSAWFDFWRSPDGYTRGNVALGLTLGRVSASEDEDSVSNEEFNGTLLNFYAGLGGDHFLSPHFALGAEGGFQGTFAIDLKDPDTADEFSLSASGLYGMIRTMIVF
jgi:hypothetical protein